MTCQLILDDCLSIMKTMPDGGFDAIITDPPYNVSITGRQINRRKGTKFEGPKNINLDFGYWDHGQTDWKIYIDDFVRLLKHTGVLIMFYDKLHLGTIGLYLQDKHGFQVRHIGNYIKTNPAPQARKVKWQNGAESFLVATKNKGMGHHFNYKLGQSPDYFMRSVNYKHEHPTQKPLDLMEWIVRYWSFEGDTVLDPFAGSGTTLVACERTGRNSVGIEKDPNYYAIAQRRVQEAGLQKPLFVEVSTC